MKTKHLLATTAFMLALGTALPAAAQFPPPGLAIHDIGNDMYLIQSAASGNVTVFMSDDALLLVDSKLPNEHDEYMELLRTVTDLPVRYVINTHMHGDHTGGNTGLEGLGAHIIATENTRQRLADTQETGLPVMTFNDHMRLYFGGKVMDLHWLGRGHTDGDLVIHLPEEGMLLSGDLYAGSEPSLRLIDYNGGGSLMEWSTTLERVLELEFETVIPGHREVTDRAGLQGYLDEIVQIQDLIRELNEAGRSPEDIQTAVTNEFGQFAAFILPSVQAVIDELD